MELTAVKPLVRPVVRKEEKEDEMEDYFEDTTAIGSQHMAPLSTAICVYSIYDAIVYDSPIKILCRYFLMLSVSFFTASSRRKPIPVSEFEDHVAELHKDRERGFEADYDVSVSSPVAMAM